jgi:formate hydrogenlyase subunit 3/multisubunit Na+/H+ antiporter MnhD subunit
VRYRLFFLLAMAGNLGLIVALDTLSFYFGFTLMGLAAYGLIVHPATRRAAQAARRYLIWTIAGELTLFVAIVMLAMQHDGAPAFSALQSSPPAGFVVLLLITGFGIKAALPGLHLWLPQAYAVTPAPAVAVLSGAMIKAGLLGWLRFLPPGDASFVAWGKALIIIGVIGLVFGFTVGLLQKRARLVLGYSSISKMGVFTLGTGAALSWPAAAPALVGALAIYAAHHALVKGALFLGLGLVERGGLRPWLLAGLGFLALTLAGAPLTSGALAKAALADSLPQAAQTLVTVLTVSTFATTLLMARMLFLLWHTRAAAGSAPGGAPVTAWLSLLAVIALFPLLVAGSGSLPGNLLPISLAVLLAVLAVTAGRHVAALAALRARRPTTSDHAARCGRAVRELLRAARPVILRLRAARQHCQALCAAFSARTLSPGNTEQNEPGWSLAGGLWLGIAGLLLTAFFVTA